MTEVSLLNKRFKRIDFTNYPNHIVISGTDALGENEEKGSARYRRYREAWRLRPKQFITGSFPLHLDIETINACDLRCTMCSIDFSSMKKQLMDVGLFKKIVDEGARNVLPSIKLNFRGEPLLHPRLPEMVRHAKERGILEVQFNTNGLSLTEDKSRALIEAGLDKIIFSLDGTSAQTYNRIRLGSDYNTVVANIRRLVERRNISQKKKPSVRIQMVCMEANRNEVEHFISEWQPIANSIGLIRYRSPNCPTETSSRIEGFPTEVVPCRQLWQRLAVYSNGDIVPCCGVRKGEIILGNAERDDLKGVWRGALLERLRALHHRGAFDRLHPCRGCEVNRRTPSKAEWNWLLK